MYGTVRTVVWEGGGGPSRRALPDPPQKRGISGLSSSRSEPWTASPSASTWIPPRPNDAIAPKGLGLPRAAGGSSGQGGPDGLADAAGGYLVFSAYDQKSHQK